MTIDEFMDAVREARAELARLEESMAQLKGDFPLDHIYLDEGMTKRVRAAAKECVVEGICIQRSNLKYLEGKLNHEG